MKISLDWLSDFVAWDETPERLADRLTMLGLNVEAVEHVRRTFPGVVVGKVLETRPQKIRGEESCGMICSASELELGADAAGIMVLADDPAVGTPADALLGYEDHVLDIEVTPNRPDWLSHIGVAREVAALQGTKVALPQVWSGQQGRGNALDCVVEVADFADCPRYTAHGLQGLEIGPSPDYIQNRLRAIGARPISNVVDITNYVMFELGQPLHAFDRAKLSGNRIFVRRAGSGERIVTLDGQRRELDAGHLVIADGAGPVAVAGVMGGERSEVSAETTDVLLESAFFASQLVRCGARSLGLVTDSSYRFEREADWDMTMFAARRALHLLEQHAGAHVISDWQDRQDPDRQPPPKIQLRISQVNRLLGTDMPVDTAAGLLQQLSLKVSPLGRASEQGRGEARLMVEPPCFRRDLKLEVDLIEEIARLHGYDRITGESRSRVRGSAVRPLAQQRRDRIRDFLASNGFSEIVTSTFFDGLDCDRLRLDEADPRRNCLRILNPRHGGGVHLRTSLLPALLRVVARNINADNTLPIRLFQLGKVFQPGGPPPVDPRHEDERLLPAEPEFLQLAIAGGSAEDLLGLPADLSELKGTAGNLADLLRLELRLEPETVEPYLAAGRQWAVRRSDGARVGVAGEVRRAVREAYDIEEPVALVEIELTALPAAGEPVGYRRFSRYPAVKRDLSLLVPDGTAYASVATVVRDSGGPLLERVELFDIYRGKGLPPGRKAMGIRLKFRSDKGNLKGKTVDLAIAQITAALAAGCDATIRS